MLKSAALLHLYLRVSLWNNFLWEAIMLQKSSWKLLTDESKMCCVIQQCNYSSKNQTPAPSSVLQPQHSLFRVLVSYLLLAFPDPFLFSREILLQKQQTTLRGITPEHGFITVITNMSFMWAAWQRVPWLWLWMSNLIPEEKHISEASIFASFAGKALHVACETAEKGSPCGRHFSHQNSCTKIH